MRINEKGTKKATKANTYMVFGTSNIRLPKSYGTIGSVAGINTTEEGRDLILDGLKPLDTYWLCPGTPAIYAVHSSYRVAKPNRGSRDVSV